MVGSCVAGGRAWQEKRQLQRVVRILLECILVNSAFTLQTTRQRVRQTDTHKLGQNAIGICVGVCLCAV